MTIAYAGYNPDAWYALRLDPRDRDDHLGRDPNEPSISRLGISHLPASHRRRPPVQPLLHAHHRRFAGRAAGKPFLARRVARPVRARPADRSDGHRVEPRTGDGPGVP